MVRMKINLNLLCLCSLFLLVICCFTLFCARALAQASAGSVIIIDFAVAVDPGSSALVSRAINLAASENASAVIVQMNTPGGLLSDMVSIVTSIGNSVQSGIPVYAYIVPNGLGASAGSYIAMACNKIFMGSGSAIGPSTPIVVGGTDLEQNHTQAAMLQLMVSLAEKWGRNTTAAYDMVQGDQAFSAVQAVNYNVADGFADSLEQVTADVGLTGRQQVLVGESLYEQFISALSNPTLDGILILLGIVAIVLDIYHPTVVLTVGGAIAMVAGLIGAEAINASVFGFAILAIAAVLIVLELKLGHGFAIMAGVAVGVFGIFFLAQGLNYSPSPITSLTELELFLVAVAGIMAGLYFRWIIGPILRRSKLTGPEALTGQIGIAVTDLKPDGEVRVAGIVWKARSVSGDILKGEQVRVKLLKDLIVTVEKVELAASRTQQTGTVAPP
jgi:membrane-bound serine protease (ClpP class)